VAVNIDDSLIVVHNVSDKKVCSFWLLVSGRPKSVVYILQSRDGRSCRSTPVGSAAKNGTINFGAMIDDGYNMRCFCVNAPGAKVVSE
jgi:hypothetical protein